MILSYQHSNRLTLLFFLLLLLFQPSTQRLPIRSSRPPTTSFSTQCTFQSSTTPHTNLIVRDTRDQRHLVLDNAANTIVSSVFCWEREGTGLRVTNKATTASIGIMEPWIGSRQISRGGGVVGVASISTGSKCAMQSCVIDAVHLPSHSDRKLMQTLSDVLHSAAALEEGGGSGSGAIDSRLIEGRMCMIGEGGGIVGIAILTAFPSTTLDVVEIDSTVIEVARDYFGFYTSSNQKLAVYNSDGRDFLKDARGYYDVILLDAIQRRSKSGPSVPLRLMTYNFLKEMVRSLQNDRGVVLSRSTSLGSDFKDMLTTYVAVFGAGRVWYMQVEWVHIVVAFHLKEKSSKSKSVLMCRELLGRSSVHFFQADAAEENGGEILCDPGDNDCWKK